MSSKSDDNEESKKDEAEEISKDIFDLYPLEERPLIKMMAGMTNTAFRTLRNITKTSETSIRVGKALFPELDTGLMKESGESFRDLREVAGMTLQDLSEALDLKDSTLLEAVENGTDTLSFELTLRTASLLSRHDPVPFILRQLNDAGLIVLRPPGGRGYTM